jgi:ABC-type enterochelin transport system permease subunit
MKFGHDTLMGAALVISGGLTVAYTRFASRILLILTLVGAAVTLVIGVLLFFGLCLRTLHPSSGHRAKRLARSTSSAGPEHVPNGCPLDQSRNGQYVH